MKNLALKADIKMIFLQKDEVEIFTGTVSGNSISVTNKITNEDIGTYMYYNNVENRDADFSELESLLNKNKLVA